MCRRAETIEQKVEQAKHRIDAAIAYFSKLIEKLEEREDVKKQEADDKR